VGKLHPYQGDRKLAFEELCCQLTRTEYGIEGEFIRNEGADGDDRVEACLSRQDGTV
jgi:hypothetical protein